MTTQLTASEGATPEKAAGLVKQIIHSTAEELSAARTKIEGGVSEAISRLDQARLTVNEKTRYAADATQEYVKENPWKVVGAAAAVGLLIGTTIHRRH